MLNGRDAINIITKLYLFIIYWKDIIYWYIAEHESKG